MAGLTADTIMSNISPMLDKFFHYAWYFVLFLLVIGGIYYVAVLSQYKVNVLVREMSKGDRVIAKSMRAKEFIDKSSKTPKLQFFGRLGFGGQVINQPPSQCLVPYAGMGAFFATTKMYDLVKKDGLYFPVENTILGVKQEIVGKDEEGNDIKKKVFTVEGSGLEITRDYDHEQALLNNMRTKAEAYRNEKPSVLYAMYGLAIILAIGSFIVMVIAWVKFGNLAVAIDGLKEPLKQGVQGAIAQQIGPG